MTAQASARAKGRWRRGRIEASGLRVPWVLVVPAAVMALAFRFIPSLAGGLYAFTNWNGRGIGAKWVGLANFRRILSEPATSGALVHTLELAFAFMFFSNIFGLLLAVALQRAVKTRNYLRALYFAPVVMMPLAVAYAWQYVFDPNGALNLILGDLGLHQLERPWLGDPSLALVAIIFVLVWEFSGLTMMIYLAGLEGIPEELEESAAVDGASTWTRFRRIKLPLLAPAMTVNVTLTMIFGLRVFDQVLGLTDGGPDVSTETLATQLYRQTFDYGYYGLGAALALVLTALITAVVVLQVTVLRRREARI